MSATARSDMPSRVFCRISATPNSTITQIAMIQKSLGRSEIGPRSKFFWIV